MRLAPDRDFQWTKVKFVKPLKVEFLGLSYTVVKFSFSTWEGETTQTTVEIVRHREDPSWYRNFGSSRRDTTHVRNICTGLLQYRFLLEDLECPPSRILYFLRGLLKTVTLSKTNEPLSLGWHPFPKRVVSPIVAPGTHPLDVYCRDSGDGPRSGREGHLRLAFPSFQLESGRNSRTPPLHRGSSSRLSTLEVKVSLVGQVPISFPGPKGMPQRCRRRGWRLTVST